MAEDGGCRGGVRRCSFIMSYVHWVQRLKCILWRLLHSWRRFISIGVYHRILVNVTLYQSLDLYLLQGICGVP